MNSEAIKFLKDYDKHCADALAQSLELAGSLHALEEKTGLRRQTLSLWKRGAVTPSIDGAIALFSWLSDQEEGEL